MANIKKFYKGFSTRNYEENGGVFEIYNVKCVEEDLLNEIFTVKGDRLKMPNSFGTRIPIMEFELNDTDTEDVIREDLTAVFDRDPRVEVLNLDIIRVPERNIIIASAKLRYIEFNVTKDLAITISSK